MRWLAGWMAGWLAGVCACVGCVGGMGGWADRRTQACIHSYSDVVLYTTILPLPSIHFACHLG